MRNILLTVLALFCLCQISWAQVASKIETELLEEMSLRNADDKIRVNIIMKAQYDQAEMRVKSNAFSGKKAKRAFVVSELKRFTEEMQADLIHSVAATRSADIAIMKTHWIANAITCYATPDAIRELALRPDIRIIGFDKEKQVIPSSELQPATTATEEDEMTYNIIRIQADKVWEKGYSGEGIVVAVIDTGVNYNHEDIKDNMWEHPDFPYHGYDIFNDDNDPMDDNFHGTHCAGTVAGTGASGTRTGMAPSAKIMAVKAIDARGYGNESHICSGIEFAVEHGADVISMSLGFAGGGTESERILFRNTMANALEAGMVAAVAAGNEGAQKFQYPIPNNIGVPGNCPPPWLHPDQTTTGGLTAVICVGATNENDNAASFSSEGPATWQHIPDYEDYPYNPGIGLIRPDVCAPGVAIKSLHYDDNTGYLYSDGTSMATPCVAGAIALLLSKDNSLTPAQICEVLETTAHPLSETKSNKYGSGRINALAAIDALNFGPVSIKDYAIDDTSGNNDGKLNPGETVHITLTLKNTSDAPVNNMNMTLHTSNKNITIKTDNFTVEAFEAGETKVLENIFTISLSEKAIGKQLAGLILKATYDGGVINTDFIIPIVDYIMNIPSVVADDADGNNNGMLDPGETAEMFFYLGNTGNEVAYGLSATLSSDFSGVTIHETTQNYGHIIPEHFKFKSFNISLSESAESGQIIPFELTLTDAFDRTNTLPLFYELGCPVVFELSHSSNNGWRGAAIELAFTDGTPSRRITLESGSQGIYTQYLFSKTNVSLSWISGSADNGCSFKIYYPNGESIYTAGSAPNAGVFYNFRCDCSESGTPQACSSVSGLSSDINGREVSLTWNAPQESTTSGYAVFRDDLLIGTTESPSYADTDVIGGTYHYCIEALCADGCSSGSVCAEGHVECIVPSGLNATAVSTSEIKLSWSEETGYTYNVYRNAALVGKNITTGSYTDSDLESATEYCYVVKAVCKDEQVSVPSNEDCIKTLSDVGIGELAKEIKIYPNPADATLFVENDGLRSVTVYDITGRLVHRAEANGKTTVIATANYEAGVYILRVTTTDGATSCERIIVAH